MAEISRIQQISLVTTSERGVIVPATGVDEEQRKSSLEIIHHALKESLPDQDVRPFLPLQRLSHSPVYVPIIHLQEVEAFQKALSKAITSIVDRWWSDEEARFPARMPVNPNEEEVLKVGNLWLFIHHVG
jgi:hypothetical protein